VKENKFLEENRISGENNEIGCKQYSLVKLGRKGCVYSDMCKVLMIYAEENLNNNDV